MALPSWFSRWFGSRKQKPVRKHRPLYLEVLEDRTVPANFVVFDNPAYVDTANLASSESDTIQATLSTSLGHTVTTFTGITAADFTTALAGQHVLVIPEQEVASLAPDLSAAAIDVIRNFASAGGGVLVMGAGAGKDAAFFNAVYGFSLTEGIGAASALNNAAATGTAFASGIANLSNNDTIYAIQTASLPLAGKGIYQNGGDTTVALMNYNGGQIVYMGWDWFNAVPMSTQNGGWVSVLQNGAIGAIPQLLNPNDTPVLTATIPFTTINEDNVNNTGNLVSELFTSTDGEGNNNAGIVIVGGTNGNGTWQFSTNNGGAWTTFDPTLFTDDSALALTATVNDRIRFVPNTLRGTTAGLTIRAWDTTSGHASGTTGVDANPNGGHTAFSSTTGSTGITVTDVADTPSVTNATTPEDTQTTSGLVISRNAGDDVEVTHFKITAITNGTLFQNDGTTLINNNDFITFAQGNAGLKFTPSLNFIGTASFQVQASLSPIDSGLGGGTVTATITVTAVADTPNVTPATTREDTQSTSGLVISRNAADGAEVTHFKITAITNGTLFQNNGTTQINNGDFITFAQANAGLRFLPGADQNSINTLAGFGFDIQASTSGVDSGLGGGVIHASVIVSAVADAPVYNPPTISTNEDTQSAAIQVLVNPVDTADVLTTFFKVITITNGTLFQFDGVTPIAAGEFISVAQGTAGLKFTPTANLYSPVSTFGFTLRGSQSNSDAGLGDTESTMSITVNPIADTPTVTDATTNEDVQTTSGLVISRFGGDGAEVTHFRITNITNGTLFLNDGVTPIANGFFITFAQGNAGLKFTPAPNFFGTGSFNVEASTSASDAGVGGNVAAATITINAVADTPGVTNATTNEDTQTTSGLVLTRNPVDGAEVTHFKITNITSGTLFQNDGITQINNGAFITIAQGNAGLKFTPTANFFGTASFNVQAASGASDVGLSGMVTATITVNAVADTPSVTNATTDEDVQTTSGLVISRNAGDDAEVTHFKITGITNGTLFQNDGATQINNGDFITFAQGNAGLRFTPLLNVFGTGSFNVQASLSASDSGIGGNVASATITINPVADTPGVTNATTNEDTQTTSGLVLTKNSVDGTEVTRFKITSITSGTLFQNDGTTQINNGDFITIAQGNAGLKFTPALNFNGTASFVVQAALSASDVGLSTGVTATITVNAIADTPSVTNATTNEDVQTTSGLVISRHLGDGTEVTHFKITNIVNGTLFQNDGTTQINSGDFITFAQGDAGLKFTPTPNFFGAGSFDVQASLSNSDSGLGGSVVTATITINAVADTPSVTNATTNEDVQTTSGLVISRNPVDGAEVTHFKITNISNGTLFQNDGTTQINSGDFITFSQGNAGLKFTPAPNFFGIGSFNVQASVSNSDSGLGGGIVTATITVNAVADTPSVTDATTNEDVQTTSGLVISRNAADGAEVTHFKITAITNGTLFQNDGTTLINSGDFITFAQGSAGLKFTPAANFFGIGSFDVQASLSGSDLGLGGGIAMATITVNAVADTPSVTNATTNEDVQTTSGLVISRNPVDGAEVTHFKITAISNGTLFQNDGTTLINSGDFITVTQGNAGLKFTPAPNFFGTATFDVQASLSASDLGLGGGIVTATITVNAVADTPSVTDATTNEDVQTTSGLVISRNAADGAEVTHFKITAITNGTLFQNDGTTQINSGDFITFAQGNAGLKFTPTPDFFGIGSFDVQASLSNSDSGLGGGIVTATITVNAVADTPSVTDATTDEDTQTTSGLVITINPVDGAEVTHFKITAITNGMLFQNDGTTLINSGDFITVAQGNAGLKFTPAPDFFGTGSFDVQASLSNSDSGLGGGIVTATITVNAVADTPSVTNATTNEDVQTTSGLVISRNLGDGAEVTHFKITNITNGTLFQNDGTTQINSGDLITFAQGNAGLKFTPTPDFFGIGSFNVQASLSASDLGLGGDIAIATITINAVADTPSVTTATTNEDVQTASGLVISRNPVDDAEVTHFKITAITNGMLFQNDGTTLINSGDFITFAQGNAGLRFTPAPDFFGIGSFDVQASLSANDLGLGGGIVTATISVNAVADTPSVTNAGTNEDVQTTSGLVISRHPGDGSEVTHFRITGITGGTLFQNDGITVINGGDFITLAQGNAGLRFLPDANLNDAAGDVFGFDVQASIGDTLGGLGGGFAHATVTVDAVNDLPTDIVLSGSSVVENSASGTVVGDLTTADVDLAHEGDSHTYTLIDSAEGRFMIVGSQVQVDVGSLLDYEVNTSHTIRVRTTDADGEIFEKNFVITVVNVNDGIGNREMSYAEDKLTINLSPTGTYTLRQAGSQASFLDQDLGLTFSGSYSQNFGGQNEKWIRGVTNAFNNPWYFIKPSGQFFAWNGTPNQAAGTQLAALEPIFWAFPQLLHDSSPEHLARVIDQALGLAVAPGGLFENSGGRHERWLRGVNNQFGNPWYFLTPQGRLFAWNGASGADGQFLATLDPFYYTEISRLHNAQPGQIAAAVLEQGTATARLEVDPVAGFVGQWVLELGTDDMSFQGTEQFSVAVKQYLPELPPISDQTMPGAQDTLNVPLNGTDPDQGDVVSYFAQTGHLGLLLDRLYDLRPAVTSPTPGFLQNLFGQGEKWLKGVDNDFHNQWYFILPSGDFFAWDGTSSASGALISDLDPGYHRYIEMLYNPVAGDLARSLDQRLGLFVDPNGTFENFLGLGERWLRGTGGAWFYIRPTGQFFTQTGALVASLDPIYHTELDRLHSALAGQFEVSLSGSNAVISTVVTYVGDFWALIEASDVNLQSNRRIWRFFQVSVT